MSTNQNINRKRRKLQFQKPPSPGSGLPNLVKLYPPVFPIRLLLLSQFEHFTWNFKKWLGQIQKNLIFSLYILKKSLGQIDKVLGQLCALAGTLVPTTPWASLIKGSGYKPRTFQTPLPQSQGTEPVLKTPCKLTALRHINLGGGSIKTCENSACLDPLCPAN